MASPGPLSPQAQGTTPHFGLLPLCLQAARGAAALPPAWLPKGAITAPRAEALKGASCLSKRSRSHKLASVGGSFQISIKQKLDLRARQGGEEGGWLGGSLAESNACSSACNDISDPVVLDLFSYGPVTDGV